MADFGYDVSDYCAIDPTFGTLADFDELLAQAHARGIRVLLDWVPNHTSDQHPWFQESRRDRTNPKADWYVWRDEPANNWLASFPRGESAWEFDEQRGQYYLRCFLKEQPDLNWDNPRWRPRCTTRCASGWTVASTGSAWTSCTSSGKDLDHGRPADLPGEGVGPRRRTTTSRSPTSACAASVGCSTSTTGDRASVGEVYLLDEAAMADYYGDDDELHLCFNFRFLWAPFDAG